MSKPSSVLFPSLVALFAVPAWAATIDLPSAWRAVPPAETGGRVAWEGIVLPLVGTPLSAAVRNDRDFLYVRAGDVLTLELAFPLRRTDERPLAVGAMPGSTISIGFETEKPRFPAGGDGPPAGGPPGGMGRPGGGMGGPGGGRGGAGGVHGGEGRPSMPKQIRVWARVTLATEPTAPH